MNFAIRLIVFFSKKNFYNNLFLLHKKKRQIAVFVFFVDYFNRPIKPVPEPLPPPTIFESGTSIPNHFPILFANN